MINKIVFYTKDNGPGNFAFSEAQVGLLKKMAPEAKFVFTDWDTEKLMKEAEDCDVAVAQNNRPLPAEFYSKAINLKWVHCLMSGTDKMNVPGSEKVILTATKGIHGIPISEHVLAFMLCASRRLYAARDNQKSMKWVRPGSMTELFGSTAGVVGLGNIGTQVAKLLNAIGMNVVSLSRSYPSKEKMQFLSKFYFNNEINDFLKICDYVIICAPLTNETKNMFGREQFEKMKKTAWLINVARGQIVNENDLYEALITGKIGGAALDVAVEEPRPEKDPLWGLENVLITPHVSNSTPKKMDRITELLMENLRRYENGEELLFVEQWEK